MNQIFVFAALVALMTPVSIATAQTVAAAPGKMIYAAGGKRLAAVYRVGPDGSPAVMLDGKLVTVPASTLSMDGDKIVTSMTRKDLQSAN